MKHHHQLPGLSEELNSGRSYLFLNKRVVQILILISGLLVVCANVIAQQTTLQFSVPELVYTDAQMTGMELTIGIGARGGYNPYIDQSFWAIKQKNGKLRFYYRSMLHQSYHEGLLSDRSFFGNAVSVTSYFKEYTDSKKNPMRKRMNNVVWPRGFEPPFLRIPSDQVEYIPNVYAVSENELLGFVHVERCARGIMVDPLHPERVLDRLYAVGLAWSENGGETWTYCGDIILPYRDSDSDTIVYNKEEYGPVFSNIGGIPYVIATDEISGKRMLQVYFNEKNEKRVPLYPAVARAPIDSVVHYARRGDVGSSLWKKYHDSAWTADSYHGLAGHCLPEGPRGWSYDTHSDAVFCTATGEYLLTVNATDNANYPDTVVYLLLLFNSPDARTWQLKKVLDRSTEYMPVYSSFIAEADDAAIDDHFVGNEFNILYARRPVISGRTDATHPDLYSMKVSMKE